MTACCAIPGCDRPVARVYPRTPEAFAPLCALCRDNAASRRAKAQLFPDEAVAVVTAAAERRLAAGRATCPVAGCGRPSAPVAANTPAAVAACCAACRLRARFVVAKGRAPVACVVDHLSRRAA